MFRFPALCGSTLLCLSLTVVRAQSTDSLSGKVADLPSHLVSGIQRKTDQLDRQLTGTTEKYLTRMAKKEARLRAKLARLDPGGAGGSNAGSGVGRSDVGSGAGGNNVESGQRGNNADSMARRNLQKGYMALLQKMKSDTSAAMNATRIMKGEYLPYADSVQGLLHFLQTNSQGLSNSKYMPADVQNALTQVRQLQAKLQDANEVQQFLQQQQAQLKALISKYTNLPNSITGAYTDYNKQLYYYAAQVKQYKDVLDDPDKSMKVAMAVLDRVPAFTNFMKSNSFLSGIFNLPGAYNPGATGQGLPSRDAVLAAFQNQAVQNQVGQGAGAGAGGMGAGGVAGGMGTAGVAGGMDAGAGGAPDVSGIVQQNMQSAQGEVDQLRAKLSGLGSGGGADVDIPNFQPNNQKTRSFLHRLQYGINIQTVHSTFFYPSTSDLGLSLGYKLNDQNVIGVGASYKIGWGKDIEHISVTSEGASLRSFIDIHLKKSFYASGGFEYNYQQPFSLADAPKLSSWQQSGLIGLSKTISLKTKFFKQTKLQLLWDFLSYEQVPKAQPLKFRVGYNF